MYARPMIPCQFELLMKKLSALLIQAILTIVVELGMVAMVT